MDLMNNKPHHMEFFSISIVYTLKYFSWVKCEVKKVSKEYLVSGVKN
jgi:hypothetical protein